MLFKSKEAFFNVPASSRYWQRATRQSPVLMDEIATVAALLRNDINSRIFLGEN